MIAYFVVIFFSQVFKDRSMVTQLLRRAENAGFKAIVLTADSPVIGRREASIKNRLTIIAKYIFFYFKNLFSCLFDGILYRSTLPSYVRWKNFEGMDLEKLDKVCD